MGLQIRCYVDGNQEFIELYGNEDISIETSFAEIQDITKKNSAFTREFKVPGTNNNNYIFNYFFDINSVFLTWNPQKKFEADILYNGYELFNGYIRLNSVDINIKEKIYSITFYNGVGDVAANIGDKFLRQLDLSSLNHPFNQDVYLQSNLDPNLFPLTGTTNYAYQDGRTYWPVFNIGYNYTESLSGISIYYFSNSSTSIAISSGQKTITTDRNTPFIIGDTIRLTHDSSHYIQGIVDSVNGTTIIFTPNLGLGTGIFSSWTISRELVNGQLITDPNSTPLIDFQRQGVPNYMSFSGTPIREYYFKPAIQVKELYSQIFSQAGYEIDSEFFNTSYFEKFYLPLKFLDETIYTRGGERLCFNYSQEPNLLQSDYHSIIQSAVTCASSAITYNLTGFSIPCSYSSSTYPYQGKVSFFYDVPYDPTCTDPINFEFRFGETYDTSVRIDSVNTCNDQGPPYNGYVEWVFQIPNCGVNQGLFISGTNFSTIYGLKFELLSPSIIAGNFNYANEFPENDYKQIDFITSINKMFNFVCIAHPIKTKTIIVEPIVNYIGKGEVLDWTDKVNFNDNIHIAQTANILNGTLNFNFKLDKDYGNQQYNIASNKIFGTYKLQLNQDYKDNNINFDTMFGSPTDIALNNSSGDRLTVENMAAIKNENIKGQSIQKYNPFKILPRIVFRGLTLPNENWGLTTGSTKENWYAEIYPQDRWSETSRFTTYPFSYSGFSHYLNWNAEDFANTGETVFPEQDLYDIYYYDYVSDIISPENKIVSLKMYLTPWEVAQLKYNEKIIIKNAYFRINKISNLNLLEPDLCDVELVKLTKDYTSVPVQYYDLINCNLGGTNYHTTSNLNYNMYAYVGNYVNIFTGATTAYTSIGCFKVELGQPNANYDYDHVFIGSGYTSSGVNVYSDCGCSARTAFNVVQQVYVPPVPALTPTPTPNITATPTPTPNQTSTPTPSITPTNTMTPTTTTTNTPTPTMAASGITEALIYLERVVQSGGTVNSAQSAATINLFTSIMSYGLWDKIYAMYPTLGGVAASHTINGRSAVGQYDLAFNGGWTHNSDGMQPNGTNGYADTSFSSYYTIGDGNTSHLSIYVNLQGTTSGRIYDIGSATNGGALIGMFNLTAKRTVPFGNNTLFDSGDYFDGERVETTSASSASGMTVGSVRSSTDRTLYRDGSNIATNTSNVAIKYAGSTTYIGAQNTGAGVDYWSDNRYAFATIGSGLSNTDIVNLSNIINTYETALGRNTY
jgi:hypothetical protein